MFTPANMTEEHQLIDQTARAFVTNEIITNIDQIGIKGRDLARRLLRLAAIRRLLKFTPVNTVTLRRKLADQAVQQAGYMF